MPDPSLEEEYFERGETSKFRRLMRKVEHFMDTNDFRGWLIIVLVLGLAAAFIFALIRESNQNDLRMVDRGFNYVPMVSGHWEKK